MLDAGILFSLQIVPGYTFAIPYALAFLGLLVAFLVLLWRRPSFREFRRKRNVITYAVIMLLFALLIFQMNVAGKRALVDYSIGGYSEKFFREQTNQVNVSCGNHGDLPASFSVVLTCSNACFTDQNQQAYERISNQTVRISFSLREAGNSGSGDTRAVFFIVDENVTSLKFHVDIEGGSSGLTFMSGVTEATWMWNETQNCYVHSGWSGFIV